MPYAGQGLKSCHDIRPCFARNERGRCILLKDTYPDTLCPFCKKYREKTGGKCYPHRIDYAPRDKR